MEIVHVSAECYPMAKVGGLADVVGTLPKYQQLAGNTAKVISPMHRTKFLYDNEWDLIYKSSIYLGERKYHYSIIKEKTQKLGFDLYLVDIFGLLDREKVYGYDDDSERFTAFQIAILDWIMSWKKIPDIIHVHDHHAGLIPFMMKHCFVFKKLSNIISVLTIHNAQYQGWMGWDKANYIPYWDSSKKGLLDWKNNINPLASAIKCAWKVTTVSPSYLEELRINSNGLESLFQVEFQKCVGILNGIDTGVWDPSSDTYIDHHFDSKTVHAGKLKNKKALCKSFEISEDKPLFAFIGRLVGEKGADVLEKVFQDSFIHIGRKMNFLILGSGAKEVEDGLNGLKKIAQNDYDVYIGYNEKLSHLIYAGADFLLMPSRVEPCGLNQLYSMRYGTVPVVRKTGGLKDTVIDFEDVDGYGVCFSKTDTGDITHAISRSLKLYADKDKFKEVRTTMMNLDYSWEKSVKSYDEVYRSFFIF